MVLLGPHAKLEASPRRFQDLDSDHSATCGHLTVSVAYTDVCRKGLTHVLRCFFLDSERYLDNEKDNSHKAGGNGKISCCLTSKLSPTVG